MKLIKPSFSILDDTNYNIESIYKRIELVGRCSHKSEDKITETSAKDFVERMLNMKHLATCEFGTVYLKIPTGKYQFLDNDYFDECNDIKDSFYSNPYTKIHCQEGYHYISTNYRVLLENFSKEFISELLQYLCEPTEYHHKRYTVKFILDRGILAEFTRHRKFSFMAESSRYNNYSKDKFNNELTFIQPIWTYHQEDGDYGTLGNPKRKNVGNSDGVFFDYKKALQYAEYYYLILVKQGWKAEEARNVLPLCLKTELYMCGFAEDWKNFFKLRSKKYGVGNPHPQADELATPLYEEFIKRGYINDTQTN